MKIAFFSVIAFACSSFALPVRTNIPGRIQSLSVTINNVMQDLHHGKPSLQRDYTSGLDQYEALIDQLSGTQACSSFAPFQPRSEDKAVTALTHSREILLQFGEDLQKDSSMQAVMSSAPPFAFHPKICKAYARYTAVKPYIDSL